MSLTAADAATGWIQQQREMCNYNQYILMEWIVLVNSNLCCNFQKLKGLLMGLIDKPFCYNAYQKQQTDVYNLLMYPIYKTCFSLISRCYNLDKKKENHVCEII